MNKMNRLYISLESSLFKNWILSNQEMNVIITSSSVGKSLD